MSKATKARPARGTNAKRAAGTKSIPPRPPVANGTPAAEAALPPAAEAPPALSVLGKPEAVWDEDADPSSNFAALGRALAAAGELFAAADGGALVEVLDLHGGLARTVQNGRQLAPVIADRLRVRVVRGGKARGNAVPARHLAVMLGSEAFRQQFPVVDEVLTRPAYLPDFSLTRPGYNDGGPGRRILYLGPPPRVSTSLRYTSPFLGVMEFASPADRANAVAAALTVLLRHHWPGAKPVPLVTSTKSHGGKNTVLDFGCGTTRAASVSYEANDWAVQWHFVAALRHDPGVGVVIIDNARLGQAGRPLSSAFVERWVTDPEPLLSRTGAKRLVRRRNDVVVAVTTNFGAVSSDLMNRALPIRLAPHGNVADRASPIGNPREEYLPAHREQIEAELRGMIERWKARGKPRDAGARHPFTAWARTVGGILLANGIRDFLGNYSLRRTVDDPVRFALGEMGAQRPGEWLPAGDWAGLAVRLGFAKTLFAERDRATDEARERGMRTVLDNHREETFEVERDGGRLTLRLERRRDRFGPGAEVSTRFAFTLGPDA